MGWQPFKDIKKFSTDPVRTTVSALVGVANHNRNVGQTGPLAAINQAQASGDPTGELLDKDANNQREHRVANAQAGAAEWDVKKGKQKEARAAYDAEEAARMEQGRKRGRASTLLTGGQGLLDQASTRIRTLLGA